MQRDFRHRFEPPRGSQATVLLLHGTGGDENDLLPIGRGLAPGAALLSPRGSVDENGMARFFRRIREGVFDEDDIRRRAGELAQFATDAATQYGFDPNRLSVMGYSNGANMAAALMLLYPCMFAGAVLMRATYPLDPSEPPAIPGTPVLILAGQHDSILSAPGTEKLARALSDAGARVEVRWHNLGHELGPEDFTAARDFLKVLL